MGVPNVVYKWKSLRTLYVSVFVMNIAGCVIVVIMIVSAVKLRLGIGQYLDLVVPGNANFWPGMMFLIAFLCAPIYAIGIKLCFHLRFSSPDSIPRLNQVLFVHCALCFASMILVIGMNAVGIIHMANLNRGNHNGIIESMQEYATEVISKVRVDMIQINFQCCGSSSYKDWFRVRWMQRDGETMENKDRNNETALLSTDVPFSCCATEMLQPCIHHNILKSSEVYLYHPEHRLTISTTGCYAKVLNHARYIGGWLIVGFILLAAYQMVLALLSRLLQTAHSNKSYIGPKKDRYIAWILGSMPEEDVYNRLIYEGRDVSIEEMVPLRGESNVASRLSQMEKKAFERRSRESGDKRVKKLAVKRSSKTLNAERRSMVTLTSQEEGGKKSSTTAGVQNIKSSSVTSAKSIPTPPPSPGTEEKSIPDGAGGLGTEVAKPGRSRDEEAKRKTGTTRKNSLKELRKSLECLEKCQPPWKGGSPIFETAKWSGSSAAGQQGSPRANDLVTIRVKSSELQGMAKVSSSSSSSSLSENKKHKVCGKDSIDEDEIRIKKFCKDLSTEYKKSPYSKQRRDFSEEYNRQDGPSTHYHMNHLPMQSTDDGLAIRNQVFARFNPADAYSRFRGSTQDTMMRRNSQTHPQPPPIPISDQRRPRGGQDFSENSKFISRPLHFEHPPKPQAQIAGPSWQKQQKLNWGPRCPPAPTYFPISSRPPRPPRLPPCPYASRDQGYHQNVHNSLQSHSVRPIQIRDINGTSGMAPRFQRCTGRRFPGLQPPRFSGC